MKATFYKILSLSLELVEPRCSGDNTFREDIIVFYCYSGGRFDTILEFCGELCDLTKEIKTKPGEFVGTVTAKVYSLSYLIYK